MAQMCRYIDSATLHLSMRCCVPGPCRYGIVQAQGSALGGTGEGPSHTPPRGDGWLSCMCVSLVVAGQAIG
eukprot:scaffold687_cov119-Isochrysis_galbana.AAC.8